jgi:hypothetical protein
MLASRKTPVSAGEKGSAPQIDRLLHGIFKVSKFNIPSNLPTRYNISRKDNKLSNDVDKIVSKLAVNNFVEAVKYKDILRTIFLLYSNDSLSFDCAYLWSQGSDLSPELAQKSAYATPAGVAREVALGLSWFMALTGQATVFVLDQLDDIASTYNQMINKQNITGQPPSEIVERVTQFADGLGALVNQMFRSQTIVSCIPDTWNCLKSNFMGPALSRYGEPIFLSTINSAGISKAIVEKRLQEAYKKVGVIPPYPSWPFSPQAFEEATDIYPRHLIRLCYSHLEKMRLEGTVFEVTQILTDPAGDVPKPGGFALLDAIYAQFQEQDNLEAFNNTSADDIVWAEALFVLCQAVCYEEEARSSQMLYLEDNRSFKKGQEHFHAQLKCESPDGPQRSLFLRAITKTNVSAFNNRLQTALTAASPDPEMKSRCLTIIGFRNRPNGPTTQKIWKEFEAKKGRLIVPDNKDMQMVSALVSLKNADKNNWAAWVKDRRPVENSAFLSEEINWLISGQIPSPQPINSPSVIARPPKPVPPAPKGPIVDAEPPSSPPTIVVRKKQKGKNLKPGATVTPQVHQPAYSYQSEPGSLPIGSEIVNNEVAGPLWFPEKLFPRHVAIFGSTGSGKTVLLKRLVEEAALSGLPSIVIDLENDLVRLAQRWPDNVNRLEIEKQRSESFFSKVEVVIWTPGLNKLRPLNLNRFPDLALLAQDQDDLNEAIAMVKETYRSILGFAKNKIKEAIFNLVLNWMAFHGGGGLNILSELLGSLPDEPKFKDFKKAGDLAKDMQQALLAAMINNTLLADENITSIQELIRPSRENSTRVSVVNLCGLVSIEAQQLFLNQLVMDLFAWARANPSFERPSALLVIDEAKEFAPTQKSTPSKESLVRFASRGRKYGVGLVLATQEIKSVDTKIITNCLTKFIGVQASPATIQAAADLLKEPLGVETLGQGEFFFRCEAVSGKGAETKRLKADMCLTCHPGSSMSKSDIEHLVSGLRQSREPKNPLDQTKL